jgi:hypothetical protein
MRSGLILLIILFITNAVLSKPIFINYSTFLTDLNGKPRTDIVDKGIYFRLYDHKTGGNPLWSEQIIANARNGMLTVKLGQQNKLPISAINNADSLWLEMQIGSENPFSRQEIATSFYAMSANMADTAKIALSARKADSLGDKKAGDYALKSQIPIIPNKIDSAKSSDTASYARLIPVKTKMDSASYSDTTRYSAFAQQVLTKPTRVDTASKAMTLVPYAVTEAGMTVNGTLLASAFQYRSAKRVKLCLDGVRALPFAEKVDGSYWRGFTGAYPVSAGIGGVQVVSGISDDSFAVYIPFTPPRNAILKRITGNLPDNTTGKPNIVLSLTYTVVGSSGHGNRVDYYRSSQASTSGTIHNETTPLVWNTSIPLNTDMYDYFLTVIFEGIDNSRTAFWGAVLEFDVNEP